MIEENKIFYVYSFTNIIDNKKYIGKTNNLIKRQKEHILNSINKNTNLVFANALSKYGIDNFRFETLFEADCEEDVLKTEIFYIKLFKTNINKHGKIFGYNQTDGGEGISGFKFSEAMKEKCSIAHRKFSTEEVICILNDFRTGNFTTRKLGDKYNCSNGTITNIINNKHYNTNYDATSFNKIKKNNKLLAVYINNKLSEQDVIEIKCLIYTMSINNIASKYGVNRNTISKIKNNKTWKHLATNIQK